VTISREAQALIDYVESTGLPYRVTDVNGPGHAQGSYHYAKGTDGVGLAVDFAGVTPGVTPVTVAQMGDIYRAFLLVAAQLAELIHNGPGITQAVKDGRRVDGATCYGATTWADHFDHVHVAVPRGVFLTPMSHPIGTLEGGVMADNPDLPNIEGPLQFQAFADQNGICTGYAIFSVKTGELHGYGPGWKYYGRSEDPTP